MNTQAVEAPTTLVSAAELSGTPQYPSNDELNAGLFGEQPTGPTWATTADAFPDHPQAAETPVAVPAPERGPVILTSEKLVQDITANTIALREAGEAAGMPKPVLTIVAGQPYGESREHLLSAIHEYATTGVVPPAQGDTTSYSFGSLLPRAAEAGITTRLFLPREVADHPDTHAQLHKLGLNPEEVLIRAEHAGDADGMKHLGGVLDDLRFPVVELRQQEERVAAIEAELVELREGRHPYTPGEAAHIRSIAERDLGNRLDRLEQLKKVIDKRLADEDAKIAAIVRDENYSSTTDGVIAMMPSYTQEGAAETRKQFTNNWKDVDGLSTSRPREKRKWDEATARAVWKCAEHFAGRTIPKKLLVQLGLGQLVGRQLKEIAQPGTVIDGREPITNWTQNPGNEPVGVLMSATRGAEIIDAQKIKPARWGRGIMKLFGRKRLLIVDAGSVTITNPTTGKRETRGNLDMSTLPSDGSVEATGPRNGVGPVTGAIVVNRTVQAASHKHSEILSNLQTQLDATDKNSADTFMMTMGLVGARK